MILTISSASFSAIFSVGHLAVGYLTGSPTDYVRPLFPDMSHLELLKQTFEMTHAG